MGRRPAPFHAHGHRYRDRSDSQPRRAQQGREMGLRDPRARHRGFCVPDHRDRFRQRIGVHQRPSPARYCTEQKMIFTSSRPANSNDGSRVKQKSWARVRELVGRYRDGLAPPGACPHRSGNGRSSRSTTSSHGSNQLPYLDTSCPDRPARDPRPNQIGTPRPRVGQPRLERLRLAGKIAAPS